MGNGKRESTSNPELNSPLSRLRERVRERAAPQARNANTHTMKYLASALFALAASSAHAETADLNFGPDSFRFALAGPLSRAASGLKGQFDAGVIYKKGEDNNNDPRKSRLTLGHVGALATGDAGAKGLKAAAGLGGRLVYADRANTTGGAFALGGQFDIRLPGFERVGLNGYGYIAPSITTFSEVAHYHEYALDVDFEIVRAASLYAGYRKVFVKSDRGEKGDADSDGHIGLRLNF